MHRQPRRPAFGLRLPSCDKLVVRQRQTGSIDGGIIVLADNTPLAAVDQDNQPADDDSTMDVWHSRVIPMDNLVSKTFQSVRLGGSNGRHGATGAFTIQKQERSKWSRSPKMSG